MNCPVCKEPMIILELNQVEIDTCLSCDGIWLDSGELEVLLENEDAVKEMKASLIVDSFNSEETRKCPICRKKMEKVYVGRNQEVLIDRCPEHGLWFDKGELRDVIKIGNIDRENKVLELLNEMFNYKLNQKS